ncbi:MAG: RidA family protein [Proteobacteria bacterium]|nr:RidA family protein [Pseudomonadota bacterium]
MEKYAIRSGLQFPHAWVIDRFVFVSGQVAIGADHAIVGPGDIELQTRTTFENLRRVLREAGCDTTDLVKLNTFLVFDQAESEFPEYWKKMDAVRREYLADPGPAATAMRVSGLARPGLLIEVDGIAIRK